MPRALPAAQTYFSQHAAEWDRIRRLHVTDAAVEAAIQTALADRPIRSLLDLGTGTGRMLELFGPDIERGLGIDMSLDMLSLARARLERAGLKHCSVRQGDIYELPVPKDFFDVVLVHQVLHFLDDGARAIAEAARTLRPQGRLLVVDFAPHDLEFLREEHAHLRLGFRAETVTQWMAAAGLDVALHRTLPPDPGSEGQDRGVALARARSAVAVVSRRPTELRDGRRFVRASRIGAPRIHVSFEFFPPKTDGDGAHAVGVDRAARAAAAELRLGHLRRRRLDARAHPRDGEAHPRARPR